MSETGGLVGGRYRVTSVLGEGGMGQVAQAVDMLTGKTLALKSLRADRGRGEGRTARLFEQEFLTLSQLSHPRVVEVFDFHKDHDGTHYTMELLDGGDLRSLAPLPWRRACAVLCDVCSALSLLHSRRLLHRDLTTRNVRCTKDGKAKLIDFGAMAPFGTSKHVVGTPAFTAPEVLTGQTMDARTDLFSLGATAYYALTGRHAFPAPTLNAQRNAWRSRPQPPSRYAPDVPTELDDLVMSLLQISPVGRPRSAAEVMERLSAIAGLPLEEQPRVRQAYLSTPTLVGRDESLLRVRKQLLRATRGRGGCFVITGPAGVGRSRFLQACVLEGKLLGSVVLRADRRDGARPWGAARALLRQLHDFVPELPEPPLALKDPQGTEGEATPAAASRAELQKALCRHLIDAAAGQGLMLAVDDLDSLDEPSAALVALLAEAAIRHGLSVWVTASESALQQPGRALALLAQLSAVIPLAPLDPEQTLLLLMSVFGEVPNIRSLSDRLYAISGGSPRAVLELAQHLLDRGLLRFEAGTWTLPAQLDAAELPASLSEALHARVDALSEDARWLAQGLALSGRSSLTFEDYVALAGHGELKRVLRALDELVAASVLNFDFDSYAFTQASWTPVLRRDLSREPRRRLHERLADLFERAGEPFLALQHEYWAGCFPQALERLLSVTADEGARAAESVGALMSSLQHTPAQWREVMEGLIAWSERQARPRHERTWLRLSLTLRAIAFSQECVTHLRALLADLRRDSGLDLYEALDDSMAESARLELALQRAQERHERAEPAERGIAPREAIVHLRTACNIAVNLAGRSFDYETLAAVPGVSAFAPLSPLHELADIHVRTGMHLCAGRMERARAGYLELLRRYRDAQAGTTSRAWHLGYTNAVGLLEAGIGLSSAEERATAIENDPAFMLNAHRIRMLYALRQGDFETAEQLERRIELLRLQNAPPAIYDGSYLWSELRSYCAAEDLGRLKQALPRVEDMARALPTWKPFLQYARGYYHLLRRGAEAALTELERGLAMVQPGRHPVWPALAGGVLEALCALERPHAAVDRGRSFAQQARQHELGYQAGFIERALSLSESAVGEHARAVKLADAAIATLERLDATGLDVGVSHETRARVAIAMGDQDAFARHARRCAAQYRAGHSPVLTAKYERLLEDGRRAGMQVSDALARAGVGAGPRAAPAARKAFAALEACGGAEERVHAALRCLIAETEAAGGYLYTMQQDGATLRAAACERPPPADMDALVTAYLSAELANTGNVTVSTATESATQSGSLESWPGDAGDAFMPFLLSHVEESGYVVTGLAVLCLGPRSLLVPPVEVLPVLSQALSDAGDVVAQAGAV